MAEVAACAAGSCPWVPHGEAAESGPTPCKPVSSGSAPLTRCPCVQLTWVPNLPQTQPDPVQWLEGMLSAAKLMRGECGWLSTSYLPCHEGAPEASPDTPFLEFSCPPYHHHHWTRGISARLLWCECRHGGGVGGR